MPNVTFYIDKKNLNKDRKAPIKANITLNYKNITRTVGHCTPSDWNPKQQRVRPPRSGMKENNHIEINRALDKLQNDFKTLVEQLKTKEIQITADLGKRYLAGENINTGQKKPFWDAYIEYLNLLNVEHKTLQNYTLYYTKLREFENETGYVINYNTINSIFFDHYKKYILETKQLSWNTLATAIKKLKFFLDWSHKMKYHQESDYKKLSAPEKGKTHVSLTESELKKICFYNFGNDRLNKARDIFCFACLTGLPYSDFNGLTHQHINDGVLTKYRQKTGVKIEQHLSDVALNIINRYNDQFYALPRISSQKLNNYIKEICKICGIDTPTIFKEYKAGKETEKIAPKYELIGTHTGRKTFATIYYNNTGDAIGVQKSTGMSAEIMEKHYFGLKPEQARKNVNKAFENIKPPEPGPAREDFIL
jgi:integrase